MVDEKTVMASGPLNAPVSPVGRPAPQTFGQRMLFMWPGLLIALVLAIGVSYLILYTVNERTREDLSTAKRELEDQNKKLGEQVKAVDTANKDLKKDLEDVKAAAKTTPGLKPVADQFGERFQKASATKPPTPPQT